MHILDTASMINLADPDEETVNEISIEVAVDGEHEDNVRTTLYVLLS